MVAPQQLAREHIPGGLIHHRPIHLAAAVDNAVLAHEALVLRRDVVFDRERRIRAQLAAQVRGRRMDEKLVRLLRVVAEAIVEVVIEDGRARAKRHLTAEVRKEVKLVVVVLLRDGQGRVEHHPMDQVAELAHPTADGFAGLRVGNDHAGAVAVRGAGPSDEVPERKRLARAYEDAVDLRRGQREVDGLVVLQNRIDPAERAADERIVPTDERGKRRLQAQLRKALRGKSVAQRAECTAFFDRDAVRER